MTETQELELPMPGDAFDDGLVVASCWGNDDPQEGALTFTLLLMVAPEPDYYRVIEAQNGEVTFRQWFPNIIPAAEFYSDAIGGY